MENSKVVLVTGSSNGFGRLAAEMLARKGHRVFATMRDADARNAKTRDALHEIAAHEKLSLRVIDLDVSDDTSVDRAMREVIDDAGRIDVLVNNAGTVSYGVAESFSVETIRRLFEVNFFGVVRMNRAVLPTMRRQGNGLLIHVSSGLGRAVFPAMGIYAASKYAMEALAETYRYELAGLGIDSVVVEPGVYPTNINVAPGGPEDEDINAAYGPLAGLAQALPKQFLEGFVDRDAGEVARAIAALVETPHGERPLRTPVGAEAEAVAPLNEVGSQVQAGLFEAFGMPDMAKLTA